MLKIYRILYFSLLVAKSVVGSAKEPSSIEVLKNSQNYNPSDFLASLDSIKSGALDIPMCERLCDSIRVGVLHHCGQQALKDLKNKDSYVSLVGVEELLHRTFLAFANQSYEGLQWHKAIIRKKLANTVFVVAEIVINHLKDHE